MNNQKLYTVIIAEDEKLILNSLAKKIDNSNMGFKVVGLAEDGLEAYKLVKQYNPHVVFSDIKMPLLSGLELYKLISEKYPHIKKIILSGYSEFSYAKEAIKLDVKEYLLKPIKNDQLLKTLADLRITLDKEFDVLKGTPLNLKRGSNFTSEQISELVEKYIIENYSQDINFEFIAQHFGFNSVYLSRIFKKHIGKNPCKYLISLRLNRAKHLILNNPQLSIKEIGEMVGYPDQFYFSRIFKKYMNVSPGSLRAR